MKRLRSTAALLPVLSLLCLTMLAACTAGDLGNEEIAFIRAGQLWTIDPNGSNAFTVVAQSTPVIDYGFSPDHQLFVFRTLNSVFAQSTEGKNLARDPITQLAGDVPSTLNTVGIDGGTPIPIIDSGSDLTESAAWWSPTGNRLLYREGSDPPAWWVSQNDQPLGIARKALPVSEAIPSINTQSTLAAGISPQGLFTTTLEGTNVTLLQPSDALSEQQLPASLERVLWQPAHDHPALLYAALATSTGNAQSVELRLRAENGRTRTLLHCTCRQFAWAPNGNALLYSDGQGYTVLNLQDGTSFSFAAEHGAVPYWSPNSQALLLDGLHTLTLVHPQKRLVQVLLSDGYAPVLSDGPLAGKLTTLQPVANSPWNSDSQRFVVVTRGRNQWLGRNLTLGKGLYLIEIDQHGEPSQPPQLVDNNARDAQPGWGYVDPNTSFLF